MESSKQIEDHAAAWLARRDRGDLSAADQADFARWLEADTAHRVAYLRLEAGWEKSVRLKAFGASTASGTVPPPGEWQAAPFFERNVAAVARKPKSAGLRNTLAIAAGVLLVIAAGVYLQFSRAERYATELGRVASIPLRDGSQLTLNSASKVRVVLTEEERRIELQAGEAFFDVAKDAQRPFVVVAGDKRVIAVGTRFSVRRDGADIQVVVTDGKVRFEQAGVNADLLAAGAVARVSGANVVVENKTLRQAEEALSWRTGYLTFDETSLAEAVAEFNRYTDRRIVIEDPRLAAMRINGKFRSNNAEEFIELLRGGFNIQARESEQGIVLTAQ